MILPWQFCATFDDSWIREWHLSHGCIKTKLSTSMAFWSTRAVQVSFAQLKRYCALGFSSVLNDTCCLDRPSAGLKETWAASLNAPTEQSGAHKSTQINMEVSVGASKNFSPNCLAKKPSQTFTNLHWRLVWPSLSELIRPFFWSCWKTGPSKVWDYSRSNKAIRVFPTASTTRLVLPTTPKHT